MSVWHRNKFGRRAKARLIYLHRTHIIICTYELEKNLDSYTAATAGFFVFLVVPSSSSLRCIRRRRLHYYTIIIVNIIHRSEASPFLLLSRRKTRVQTRYVQFHGHLGHCIQRKVLGVQTLQTIPENVRHTLLIFIFYTQIK